MKKMNQESQVDMINCSFWLTSLHSYVEYIYVEYIFRRTTGFGKLDHVLLFGSLGQVTSTGITMNLFYTLPSLTWLRCKKKANKRKHH